MDLMRTLKERAAATAVPPGWAYRPASCDVRVISIEHELPDGIANGARRGGGSSGR